MLRKLVDRFTGAGRNQKVAQAVRRCAAELTGQLGAEIGVMSMPQRTGYVRARARLLVARDTRDQSHPPRFADEVLAGVVARVVADIAAGVSTGPKPTLRRAA